MKLHYLELQNCLKYCGFYTLLSTATGALHFKHKPCSVYGEVPFAFTFLLAHRIFDFYDTNLTFLDSVNLPTLHISRHLQGDFFLLPHNWIYKLTNSATLWIIGGHTGYFFIALRADDHRCLVSLFFVYQYHCFISNFYLASSFFPHFTLYILGWDYCIANKEQARIQMILLKG